MAKKSDKDKEAPQEAPQVEVKAVAEQEKPKKELSPSEKRLALLEVRLGRASEYPSDTISKWAAERRRLLAKA